MNSVDCVADVEDGDRMIVMVEIMKKRRGRFEMAIFFKNLWEEIEISGKSALPFSGWKYGRHLYRARCKKDVSVILGF